MTTEKPVWMVMDECTLALPDRFRYADVLEWFTTHHPEIPEAVVRAHVLDLTEGNHERRSLLDERAPLFRRVGRGTYEVIPSRERRRAEAAMPARDEQPADAPAPSAALHAEVAAGPPSALEPEPEAEEPKHEVDRPADIILIGRVDGDRTMPSSAGATTGDLRFRHPELVSATSAARWFVLSGSFGVLTPDEWTPADPLVPPRFDAEQRQVWAGWVVTRLAMLAGPLAGTVIRIDAPPSLVGPLFTLLHEAGAVVEEASSVDPTTREIVAEHLGRRVSLKGAESLPREAGLYAWFVDAAGARDLNRALRLPVEPGIVFAGRAKDLRHQIVDRQLFGQARESTLRMTLAAVLGAHLRLAGPNDPRLQRWMHDHLRVSVWTTGDSSGLRDLVELVIAELDPPLNLASSSTLRYRERLNEMRTALR